MRKIALCAALACVCCMSSIPVNAAELSDDDAYRYYDSLQAIIANYGLDTTAQSGENDIVYYYGVATSYNVGCPVACLWIGTTCYRAMYRIDATTPFYQFGIKYCNCEYTDSYVGNVNAEAFYYDPTVGTTTLNVQLLAGQTSNLIGYDTIAKYTDRVDFNELSTLDDLLLAVEPTEPTEPVETAAPPFTLPQDWIDGGETLPDATEVTYPSGFDPEDAFEQFEDITYELEEDTKSGIGFFWEFLTRIIDSLGIWNYVFFAMLFVLIVWFLKGA